MNKERTPDIWENRLEDKLKELQECQKHKTFNSCMECEAFLNCELRDGYVKAVYESMNKGQGGDFEF